MSTYTVPPAGPFLRDGVPEGLPFATPRPPLSAVSWSAIAAGAAGAAALSMVLLILGVGLGLSSLSPWANSGASATTLGWSTIAWLTFTQLAASAMGGYLAGRLRSRWADANGDEIYFRDTAHGFLSWAVASLATAALLTSTIAAIVSGGVQAGAAVAGGAVGVAAPAALRSSASADGGDMAYFVDALFRREATASAAPAADGTAPTAGTTAAMPEALAANRMAGRDNTVVVSRIFMNSGSGKPLPADDLRYVSQLVAQSTGLSATDAEKRVSAQYGQLQNKLRETEEAARIAADKARRASAYSALWMFVSLMVGAFVASLAATFGGRRRDA